MPVLTRLGKCQNCGECCNIYNHIKKRSVLCDYFSFTRPGGHCLIHSKRPEPCRDFPRSPDDLERVKLAGKVCGYYFVDEKGVVVDAWMDGNVKLTKIKKS